MAQIIFYEKPGCINNRRQKQLLRQSGHTVVAKNLLAEDWSVEPERLREFFAGSPVSAWFNRGAPSIKQGLVNPDTLEDDQAIGLMLTDPLLIRRPLMQVGQTKMAGFDEEKICAWIGLDEPEKDLKICPKTRKAESCHG
ncbi:ArsC/Spx/MgsR family protein [Methylomarinum vadi]|uniref:ArsC/Spx/MgsR family protein n=1 Tax=Methylomarinum vadi TaxID=438855 RepID=UPI0004DF8519|nr:ArsC/Spx/MgsR family protein [Methylomarinum vadi]